MSPSASSDALPADPVLVRFWRGDFVESVHRGAWVLADGSGVVHRSAGAADAPVFARSSVKALQALPLVECGAAERFGLREEELALALASHSGEACHTDVVRGLLGRLGLGPEHLRCGAHPPNDSLARHELVRSGREPSPLHNNCSGKHAGFLALALHLGVPPERYLDPSSEGQALVRRAIASMAGVGAETLVPAVDGCSAPTYRLPLASLATAFARLASPERLAPERRAACERMRRAVASRPELLAGSRGRLCTDLVRATDGRLFPKIGAEAVYAIGFSGLDRGLAIKIADGGARVLPVLVLALLSELDLVSDAELERLAPWTRSELSNHAGLVVGRAEALVA